VLEIDEAGSMCSALPSLVDENVCESGGGGGGSMHLRLSVAVPVEFESKV
jgi:hypothetical protein